MVTHFAPAVKSTIQGEVQNYLGLRPISDDAKAGLGAISGEDGAVDSLSKKPAFLEWLVKRQLTSSPNVIGGPV